MKKILKKNQLTILVLALMLVTAGYLNYNSNYNNTVATGTEIASLGDATLVNSNAITNSNEITNEINSPIGNAISEEVSTNTISTQTKVEENTVETNSNNNADYFVSSKLERETMYSEMLASYQKILDSSTISDSQKEAAQKEITKINDTKNAIMISENLIKTKGFNECLVLVNDDSINIVIDKEELNKEDTAQIQSIIAREMDAKLENIHIMNK